MRVVVLCLCFIAVSITCSSATEQPLESPSTKVVLPAPQTIDPQLAEADLAVIEILDHRKQSVLVLGSTFGVLYGPDSAEVNEHYQRLLTACEALQGTPHTYDDLWPTPYKDVVSEAWLLCGHVDSYEEDRTSGSGSWSATRQILESIAYPGLLGALDALPDYSEAQLRRAVQQRQ